MSQVELECRCRILDAYMDWAMEQLPPSMMVSVMGWRYRLVDMWEYIEAVLLGS